MPQPSNVVDVLSPINKAFFEYWKQLEPAQRLPRKSAINPAAITKIIPHLVIYERKEPTVFKFRLMGTQVVDRLGVDLTSRNLLDFLHYAAKDEAQRDLNRIVDEPCGQFLVVRDQFTSGREAWVEILRLPLTGETSGTRFIIGCTEEIKTTGFDQFERNEPKLIAQRIKGCFFDLTGDIHKHTIWITDDDSVLDDWARW